ncbi:TPA: hypothetical protein QCY29_003159 [Bacillus toyonensis]|nr:hypothetical protein [Bacillus toyonensis]
MTKNFRRTFKGVEKSYRNLDLSSNKIKLVTSMKNHNYSEVIKCINTSNEIIIFTYSFTDKLIEQLKEAKKSATLHLVINNLTLDNLKSLENILPEKFDLASVTIYLCPINHSKIMYTDTLCYIGSQNLGAWYKFEAGVVLESSSKLYLKLKQDLKILEQYSTVLRRNYSPALIEVEKQISVHEIDLEEKANEYIWSEIKEKILSVKAHMKKLYKIGKLKEVLEEIENFLECLDEYDSENWIIKNNLLETLDVEVSELHNDIEELNEQKCELMDDKNDTEKKIEELEEKYNELDNDDEKEEIQLTIDEQTQQLYELDEKIEKSGNNIEKMEEIEEELCGLIENLEFFKDESIGNELKKTVAFWENEGFILDYVDDFDLKLEEQFSVLEDAGLELATTREKNKLTSILKKQKEYLFNRYKRNRM